MAPTGRGVLDGLTFSLEGRNGFDGTPVNPAVPDGLPGGSSSGSAAAGHLRLPQISLPPGFTAHGHPLGLGAIGWVGGDTALLGLSLWGSVAEGFVPFTTASTPGS